MPATATPPECVPAAAAGTKADAAPPPKTFWGMLKQTAVDWNEDNAMRLAAAMAAYIIIGLAPLLVILVKLLYWFMHESARPFVQRQASQLIGGAGADAITAMIDSSKSGGGTVATIVSTVIVLFSASGIFASLQDALNTIWEIKPKPNAGWWQYIRKRFLSMAMVFGIALLLLVSLFVTTVLGVAVDAVVGGHQDSLLGKAVGYGLDFVVTVLVVWALFMAVFKFLPDAKLAWRDVWLGALVTAVLFKVGQYGLALYFNLGSATSAYGAFGSLVAVLLWGYYSSMIMFFGAEFTQVYARAHGREIEPEDGAVRVTEEERAQQGLVSRERLERKTAEAEGRAAAQSRGGGARPTFLYPPRPAVVTGADTGHAVGPKDYLFAAGGIAAGALGAWYWATQSKKPTPKQAAAVHLDERIRRIEDRIGRVSRLKEMVGDVRVHRRIRDVERQLRHARTAIRANEHDRPKWAVRLGDLIAGNK